MIGVGLKSYCVDESIEFGERSTLGDEVELGYKRGGGVIEISVGNNFCILWVDEYVFGALVVVLKRGVPLGGWRAGGGVILKPESVGAVFAIFRDSWK